MKDQDLQNIWESYVSDKDLSEAHCNTKKVKKEADDKLKDKADLDDDGEISDYKKKRSDAIAKSQGKDDHVCALKVSHESYGLGTPIHGRHAHPDENGNVAWYAVMFEHGTEVVDTIDVEVLDESSHGKH